MKLCLTSEVLILHTVKRSIEPPFIPSSLTFCSLSKNQISDEGACELAAVLQVNRSLQELE